MPVTGTSLLEAQMEKVKDSLLVTERHAKQLEDQLQKLQSLMAANHLAQPKDLSTRSASMVNEAGLSETPIFVKEVLPHAASLVATLLPDSGRALAATCKAGCGRPTSQVPQSASRSGSMRPCSPEAVPELPARVPTPPPPQPLPPQRTSPSASYLGGEQPTADVTPPPTSVSSTDLTNFPVGGELVNWSVQPASEREGSLTAVRDAQMKAELDRGETPALAFAAGLRVAQEGDNSGAGGSLTRMPSRLPPSLEMHFDLVDGVGEGSFAIVRRIQDKRDGQILALKVMEKHPLLIRNMAQQVHREVKVQSAMRHPNILRLFDFLEDDTHIYMLLELACGGGLIELMQQYPYQRLPENLGGWIFGQVVDGVSYLHARGCIHRDLKPDNVLLGEQYCAKVCDFGWCADLNEGNPRRTTCGTLDYMAPEVLLNEPHSLPVDLWSLGVLLYEILAGHTPFMCMMSRCSEEFMEKILKVEYPFPPWFSNESCHLIHCLLQRQAGQRMATPQMLQHPWTMKYYATTKQAGMHPRIEPPPASPLREHRSLSQDPQTTDRGTAAGLEQAGFGPGALLPGGSCHQVGQNLSAGISKSLSRHELLTGSPPRALDACPPRVQQRKQSPLCPPVPRGAAGRRSNSPPLTGPCHSGPMHLMGPVGHQGRPLTREYTKAVPSSPGVVPGRPVGSMHTTALGAPPRSPRQPGPGPCAGPNITGSRPQLSVSGGLTVSPLQRLPMVPGGPGTGVVNAGPSGISLPTMRPRGLEVGSSGAAPIAAWPGLRDQTPAALRPAGSNCLPSASGAVPQPSVSSATNPGTATVISGNGTPLPPPGQASPRVLFGRNSRDGPVTGQ